MCTLAAPDKARLALIVAFAALLGPAAVGAQMPETTVIANIPFAFQVGSSHLAAGKYKVQLQGNDLLWIKGDSGAAVMFAVRESAKQPSPDSAIVFHHYGGQYFLREVRTEGTGDVLWFNETKAERRAKLEQDAFNPNSGPRGDSKVEIALLAPLR